MRNVDERLVAQGGSRPSARPMLAAERNGFVERNGLWTEQQYADAAQMRRVMDELGIELVRVCFTDQIGVVRGKTVTRRALSGVLRSGLNTASSLLLKDPSGKSQFEIFDSLRLDGHSSFSGAGDLVLVPDPSTFRVLPWSRRTGMVLGSLYYADGVPVQYCTRGALHRQLAGLAERDLELTIGPELEFHVFARAEESMHPDEVGVPGSPGKAPAVLPLTSGCQLLRVDALDSVDRIVEQIHEGLTLLDLPLRSIELEFGPSQFEITLEAGEAAKAADDIVLCRTAIKQICQRLGLHATFMARPLGAQSMSTGWHLHQSLRHITTGAPLFAGSEDSPDMLSSEGMGYLGGLLEHAAPASAFTTPTVNGYKRYQPLSLAPNRVLWGLDNKGAMVRVVGRGPGDPNTHLENRSGEPGANPYLYILSQLVSGLDGMDRKIHPGPPTDSPYVDDAERLPRTLGDAVTSLDGSALFRDTLGDEFVDWYVHLKRAEFGRYLDEVSDWEQREYFDLL